MTSTGGAGLGVRAGTPPMGARVSPRGRGALPTVMTSGRLAQFGRADLFVAILVRLAEHGDKRSGGAFGNFVGGNLAVVIGVEPMEEPVRRARGALRRARFLVLGWRVGRQSDRNHETRGDRQ